MLTLPEVYLGLLGVQVPYFHVESKDYLAWKESQLNSTGEPRNLGNKIQRFRFLTRLYNKYQKFGENAGVYLHVPWTLDESYYTHLECATERDRDQVIYKYVDKRSEENHRMYGGIFKGRQSDFSAPDAVDPNWRQTWGDDYTLKGMKRSEE